MSHAVSIQTEITDMNALKIASQSLGLKFQALKEPAPAHSIDYGIGLSPAQIRSVTHEIIFPGLAGRYRMGIHPGNKPGVYGLLMSQFGLSQSGLGPGAGRLLQAYGVAKTEIEARKKGYRVQRETTKDGTVRMVLTKAASARN